MSMSTHVVGFRPPDEKWKQMKAAYDACVVADVPVPKDVMEFFNWSAPSSAGVRVEIPYGVKRDYDNDMESGFEIDLHKLPKDVTILRFWNSY